MSQSRRQRRPRWHKHCSGIPRSQTKVPALPMPNKTTYSEPPSLLLSGVGAYGACQTPCSCRLTRCLSTHNLILPHLRRDSRTAVPRPTRYGSDIAQLLQMPIPIARRARPSELSTALEGTLAHRSESVNFRSHLLKPFEPEWRETRTCSAYHQTVELHQMMHLRIHSLCPKRACIMQSIATLCLQMQR